MPFPAKLLGEGEEVVLDLHPHWWLLSGPVAAVMVVLAGTIAALAFSVPTAGLLVLTAILLLCLFWLLKRYAQWHTNNFVLTTDRIIHRVGVLAKHGREIPLDHINDISCVQGPFERILGAGDVIIESAGEQGQQRIEDLPKPARVQNEIYRQIDAGKNRQAERVTGRRELSIPEQIEQLDELRQRGVISQGEFDSKKTELLDRL
ncbi:MAG TPA: PH domain-containing protein [Acidimicrobiales bacterium]|nr:PH domain-containing protein [Acidimicrobiales bacterium]